MSQSALKQALQCVTFLYFRQVNVGKMYRTNMAH